MSSIREYIARKLKWSERYFKTDMIYVFRGGIWLGAGHVLITGTSFVLSIVFANMLPKDAYGIYRYILATTAVISAFSLTGLSTAIVQSVARGFDAVLKSSFKLSLRWSLPTFIISYSGAIYYFVNNNIILGISLIIAGTLSPLMNSAGLFAGYLNGKKDFRKLSILNTIDTLIPALVLICTLYLTTNVLIIILAYYLSHTLSSLILYYIVQRTITDTAQDDPKIRTYAVNLSFFNIISIIVAQIDKILVFTFLGATELAIYGFSIIFPDQIRNVLKNLNSLMIPKISEKKEGDFLGIRPKTVLLALIIIAITIIYIVLSSFLYHLLFPQYIESIFFSQIYALSILSAIAMIPSAVLIAYKKEKELAKVNIFSSIIQLLILFPAVYWYGLWGAIVAKVASSFINSGISFFMIRKQYQLEKHAIL